MTNIRVLGVGVPLIAAADAVTMSPLQMLAWAVGLSFMGGFAAAWRTKHDWQSLVKTGLNTSIFGASFVLVLAQWTMGDAVLAWSAIGVAGVLSLGGMAVVDWGVEQAKKRIGRKINDT